MARRRTLGKKRKSRKLNKSRNNKRRKTYRKMRGGDITPKILDQLNNEDSITELLKGNEVSFAHNMGDDFKNDDTDKFKLILKYEKFKNQGEDSEEPIYVPIKIDIYKKLISINE